MESFAPLLLLLFFWIFIGIPVSLARKAANQKKQNLPAGRKAPPSAEQKAAAPEASPPERYTTLTPSLSEPDHDDSVFTGSLGAFSTEGYDPCHDQQMSKMEKVCQPGKESVLPQEKASLPFGWTGNDVVRGVVMSEILNRKH